MGILSSSRMRLVFIVFLVVSVTIFMLPSQVLADTENLTTWTYVYTIYDCLDTTPTKVTWTDMQNQEEAYLIKDLGEDYIDGDFTYDFEVYFDSDFTGYNIMISPIAITNTPGSIDDLMNGDSIVVYGNLGGEVDLSVDLAASFGGSDWWYEGLALDTLYYATLERESALFPGFDTVSIEFFTDSGRTVSAGGATIGPMAQTYDFQYVQIATSPGFPGETDACNGYVQNVDLGEDVDQVPTIATLESSEVTSTGMTLNGELLTMGDYTPVDCFFEYGPTVSYGYETSPQEFTAIGTFDERLTPYHQYHYRAVVEYDTGQYVYGSDVLVSFTGYGQAEASVSDPGALPGDVLVDSAPEEIPYLYDEGNTGGLIFQDLIDPALAESNTPVELFWYPIAFFIAIATGFAVYKMTRQLLIQALCSGFVMAAFCGGGVLGAGLLPWATVLVFVLEAGAIVLIEQKQYV